MSRRTLGECREDLHEEMREALLREERLGTSEYSPIPGRHSDQLSPLSFAQERIWLLDQFNPGSYLNRQFGVRLQGALDVPVLEQALGALVRRHDILRTTYRAGDSGPQQSIAPDCSVRLPVIDLTDWPESQREGVAMRLAAQEGAQLLNLRHGPLLRAKLLRLGKDDHMLVLTAHQITMDTGSKTVLAEELLRLYAGERLSEPPIQYGDFAAWQRERVKGRLFKRELRYWSHRLEGAPVLLELPADRSRPAVRSHHGSRVALEVSPELTAKLRVIGAQEDCTVFMTLLAVFQTLVHRYTGGEDIVIGAPATNRTRPELAAGIGCFSNMLALRTELSGDLTFRELLARVRTITLGAQAHQDFPFERLVETLESTRDPSFAPLFQLFFEFENAASFSPQIGGLKVTPFEVQGERTEFDLTLHLEESGRGLTGWMEFATDLFDRSTIERFAEHYMTLLEGAVGTPEERLSRLPLLTAEERAWQRTRFDRTTAMLPPASPVHDLIREQTAIMPDAVAVEYEAQHLTYAELDLRSEQLAQVLNSLDIGPNDLVAVCVDRSLEMIVALLGILKAGAAYLPLAPDLSEEQLMRLIRDARPRALLTMSGATRNLSFCRKDTGDLGAGLELPMIYLDAEVWDDMACEVTRRPRSCPGPEDLAYVIYTSGSSGHPKGVQIPHRAFANLIDSMQESPGISARDTLLAVTGFSCDIAGLDLLLPLTVGAKVVIASDAALADGLRLTELFGHVRPTIMQAMPATWRLLLEAGWQGHRTLKILCGGEAWSEDLAEQLLGRCGSLWNVYGPTEATVWSAVSKVEAGEPVLIGEPITNTSFHILDQYQQPVPIGVPGELYIGGDGVALGYLGQPELTTRCFIPDSFRPDAGSWLYRTGDRVRYLPAGGIEFLGRMDLQAQIRGLRVESGEIEMVLRSHPAVAQAVVVVREGLPADQWLVAYIVPARGYTIASEELQKFLRHTLPEYMVPSAIVTLRVLPTTPNGKMDRNALPTPERSRFRDQVNPHSELERMILEIWQELLGISRIGVHDDFFDLGGHSLLVVQMHRRLREALDREIPILSLFQNTTVSRLSEFLGGCSSRHGGLVPGFVSAVNIGPRTADRRTHQEIIVCPR